MWSLHYFHFFTQVSGKAFDKNFTDIMKHYRNQPQASSHVYRSVLLRPRSGVAAPASEFCATVAASDAVSITASSSSL